jgi:hypothetical protein
MDRLIEQPLAASLGALAIARVLWNVRDQSRVEDRLAIGLRIKAAIEVEIRTTKAQPCQFGDSLQSFQPIWKQHRIRFVDRSDRQGCQNIAMVLNDGDDFFTQNRHPSGENRVKSNPKETNAT